MSLVVETGAGAANAESFISVADADARRSGFGDDTWADLTTAQKEEALRRSTQYMEQAYRQRWIGYRLTQAQALSWPRYGACVEGYPVDSDVVPAEVANACADLAFKAAAADLAPDLTRGVIREKVGPIETEYEPHGSDAKRYRAIDMALAPYLKAGGGMPRLMRA